ncbi:AzlC family ABC transporter permease [Aquipuribacter sp. SD81]|uniref:AzlC family ABC transporter permease n=1 Tax=Aquipuribacter sp. SD81 TaxID=3127703 RepID=UPI00301597FA
MSTPGRPDEGGTAVRDRDAVRAARRDGVGLGLLGVYGVSFGAVAVASGLAPWQAVVLSAVGFTGGSQFALAAVAAAGGAPVTGLASAWLLGVRNALYAVRLTDVLPRRLLPRALAAHLVIDETTAMAVRHEPHGLPAARAAFWTTGLMLFATWNTTTVLGAFGVQALGDPDTFGLDAAAPAAFLALLWPYLRERRTALVAGLAVVVALLLSFVAPAGVPVLAGGAVALLGLSPRLRPETAVAPEAADASTGEEVRP